MENLIKETINQVKPIVRDDKVMKRTLMLMGVLLAMVIGFLEYFRRVWRDDFELKTPGGNGALIFRSNFDDGFQKVVFLVPASQCWVSTQLEFKPGETISFKTSGQVHLAQNQIRQEEVSAIGWSNPAGSPFVEPPTGAKRSQFLISKHTNRGEHHPLVGNLVGYLHVPGLDEEPGPDNPNPVGQNKNRVFHIGAEQTITNETGHKAYLWLSVNDIVLNSSEQAELAYKGDSIEFIQNELRYPPISDLDKQVREASAIAKWNSHVRNWDTIVTKHKWDLFFNDNIGTYLVFIEKKKA